MQQNYTWSSKLIRTGRIYGTKLALQVLNVLFQSALNQGDGPMKLFISRYPIIFALLLIWLMLPTAAIAMEEQQKVTITGEVNEESQIVGRDGIIYEIAITEVGNEVMSYIGAVVEVRGTLVVENNVNIIYITSFKLLESI